MFVQSQLSLLGRREEDSEHTLFGGCWHQPGHEVAGKTKPEYKQGEGRGEDREEG